MALYGYPGVLLASNGGSLATSQDCCCDRDAPPTDDPFDPNNPDVPVFGPVCNCQHFFGCTINIKYDDLEFSLTPNVGGPFGAPDVSFASFVQGRVTLFIGGALVPNDRVLYAFFCSPSITNVINGQGNVGEGQGNCGQPKQRFQAHLEISYGPFLRYQAGDPYLWHRNLYTSFYKFNIPNERCADYIRGQEITVSEVWRDSGQRVTYASHRCNATCEDGIASVAQFLGVPVADLAPFGYYRQASPWVQQIPTLPRLIPVQPEGDFVFPGADAGPFWPCQRPKTYAGGRPTVTVVCPP